MYLNLDIMNTKVCKKCNTEKEFSYFTLTKRGKYGYHSICKECCNKSQVLYRKKDPKKWSNIAKKYRNENKEHYNKYDKLYRNDYIKTIEGYASRLFSGSRNRAIKKGLEFNITSNWVKEKLSLMKCEATNFDLTIVNDIDGRVNPLKPTLDRIDNNKGYTIDNTRVTCWWWNVMKQDWSDDTIINLIKKYKNE